MTDSNLIQAKIEHTLSIYPIISHTMLQTALGPQIKAMHWRPILDAMIHTGIVKQESLTKKSPSGRNITYVRLSLQT